MSSDCGEPILEVQPKRMAFRLSVPAFGHGMGIADHNFLEIKGHAWSCILIVEDFRMLHLTTCTYSDMETAMEVITIPIRLPVQYALK